jgi:hypothetical protein
MLRGRSCQGSAAVLGAARLAPIQDECCGRHSTGTFLRSFTFGHVCQLDRLTGQILTRVWATGELTVRMDSGFWSAKTITTCRRHGIRYSVTVRQTTPIRQAIAAVDEDAWVDILYPEGGPGAGRRDPPPGWPARRAPHPPGRHPGRAVPTWRYHAFVTDRVGTTVWLDADHRRHGPSTVRRYIPLASCEFQA